MDHNLFKPKNFEEAIHSVVGDCNGIDARRRFEEETPLFAEAIAENIPKTHSTILDYGCGCGRLAKAVLNEDPTACVIGVDRSSQELEFAKEYISDSRFQGVKPEELNQKVDLAYCVYVLQHVPAVEIREILMRIWTALKDDGVFIYCSSDYRMAVRYDGQGFFDDQFLGVNLREEINRFFTEENDLFTPAQLDGSEILDALIRNGKNTPGGIPHPAKIYRRRPIKGHLFNGIAGQDAQTLKIAVPPALGRAFPSVGFLESTPEKRAVILRNRLSPGDVLVMSVAVRALKLAHPHFQIDVDTPTNFIFEHNPYVTKLDGNGEVIQMHYEEIHKSGTSGRHFVDGHRKHLEQVLGVKIPNAGILPDLVLSQDEKLWPSPLLKEFDYDGPYWCINAGSKNDYPLKWYHRWQEVVDLWNLRHPGVRLVQIGQLEHDHPPLVGVLDMRGKTDGRKIFRLIEKSSGVFTCVSFPMHIAAALEKPAVVVAGGREGTRWELYPHHRFLYMNGALPCCSFDGCWKSKIEECSNPVSYRMQGDVHSFAPLCLEMIRPEDIVRAADLYYLGGKLKEEQNVGV